MNIIKNKKIVNSFGQQIDLLNTLGGGVSMAQATVSKKKNRMVVSVSVPTVSPESLHVVVDYNNLIIYGTLPQKNQNNTAEATYTFPIFTNILPIPFETDVENIRAVFEEGQLQVILPFAEGRNMKARAIDIE